jgi:two-component sensor histidine kinase
MLDSAVLDYEIARQKATLDALPILADIARADVVYYDLLSSEQIKVLCHAQPHTVVSIYAENLKGTSHRLEKDSVLGTALFNGSRGRGTLPEHNGNSQAHQEVWPVRDYMGKVIGAISIETSDAERASYRHRSVDSDWRDLLEKIKDAVVHGTLPSADKLSPFRDQDGLVVVDNHLRILYVNLVAEHLYARIGIPRPMLGYQIGSFETGDERLIIQAVNERVCVETEEKVRDDIWIRKAIPIFEETKKPTRPLRWLPLARREPVLKLALLLIHDVTTQRREEQIAMRQAAMIKEIHHRVKNNLQTLISLARFQIRRTKSEETKQALADITNRIFAIAQVHELLASDNLATVKFKDICKQIAARARDTIVPTEHPILIEVEGDPIQLPSRQATACALIVNELVQNALEHGFESSEHHGLVRIQLQDDPHRVWLGVVDNGRGLPDGFDVERTNSLGLKIVRTLVQDVHGELTLTNLPSPAHGLKVEIAFSKI